MKKLRGHRADFPASTLLRNLSMPTRLIEAAFYFSNKSPGEKSDVTIADLDRAIRHPREFHKCLYIGPNTMEALLDWYGPHRAAAALREYAKRYPATRTTAAQATKNAKAHKKIHGHREDYPAATRLIALPGIPRTVCEAVFYGTSEKVRSELIVEDLDRVVGNPQSLHGKRYIGIKTISLLAEWYGSHPAGNALREYAGRAPDKPLEEWQIKAKAIFDKP